MVPEQSTDDRFSETNLDWFLCLFAFIVAIEFEKRETRLRSEFLCLSLFERRTYVFILTNFGELNECRRD